ncbi:F-actin-uncapping protein LRRC16A [Channa argus]|uniref:F-actin-uncapping protein LRRC16A n=1 Tax=Channa argus TaxID=215402 RepID=A0A6G1PN56_CHAAH|nr:F-actin-uncapping protein LRRC16A [Channa argus]
MCACALASHRAYLLTARIPTKVEHSFNYLEIQGIACNKPTQLGIEYERGSFSLKLLSTEEVNEVVAHIGNCLLRICPGLPPSKVMKKLCMEPPDRLTSLQTLWENSKIAEPGPCGGFSQMYRCVCDWLGLPYREEVQWSTDVCEQILRVVSRSSRLEELVLDNAGLKTDFAQKLAAALAHNPSSGLTTINLANNPLEDRGVSSLGAQFAKLNMGLKHLNFSKTSLSPKGVNSLCQSLSANPSIPSSLVHLDLSGNILRGDDMQHFYHFLGQHNSLATLDLSNTDCSLDQVCSALLRGSVQHLSVLNVSKSTFPHRKGKDVTPSFKHFFSSAMSLSSINMSGTKLPPEALKALLLGLASNLNVKDVSLDLSCCELRSGGSQILEGCIAEIPNISSLDISDNGLDSDLSTLLVWLAKNRSIRHLSLGKNFTSIKSKTVIWDKNNTSPQGLQDVAAALEKNFTIRFMPIPIIDASQALKANPEKTEDALLKIENYLYRNHETRKYLQEQAYRLQQGIVTTTTQQMIDRICVKVQDHLNSLRNSEKDAISEDVKSAENLLRDARNSKTLLPNLYHLGSASREEVNSLSVGPIQEKLESMAGEVITVMEQQLQTLLESMMDTAESLCPHVMKRSNLRTELIKASSAKMIVPKSFVTKTLLEQSGVDIINKISEVKLSLASFLSDRIVDEILEALSTSQHTLADHLVRRGRPLVQQESLDLDVPEEKIPKRASAEILEAERLEDLETCMVLPKLEQPSGAMVELPSEEEKKLQHFTKLRPRRNKKTHSTKVPQINSTPSQDGEQNGLMGRVDEGVDEFFSKKVTKMGSKRSLKSSESQDGEKKKSKGGFLNLIKRSSKSDKLDKSEKNQGTAPPSGSSAPISSAPVSTILEEPSSPKMAIKSPAPEPKSRDTSIRSQATDYSSSSDRSEELRTPDSIDEPWEGSDGRGSPQGGRRYPGVQMMGSGLLAEMKAKQERRAHKSSSPDRPDSNATAAKPQSTIPEGRSPTGSVNKPEPGSPEKTKPERVPRLRATSSSSSPGGPGSPKPPVPQGAKPALAARPSIPQKPRTTSSNRSIVRAASDSQRPSPLRTNSEDHGLFKTKDQSPNLDKAMGKKSSDSGEEAEKDFILI